MVHPCISVFLSASLSHYEVILGEQLQKKNGDFGRRVASKRKLKEKNSILDYVHNALWQWHEGLLLPLVFNQRPNTLFQVSNRVAVIEK